MPDYLTQLLRRAGGPGWFVHAPDRAAAMLAREQADSVDQPRRIHADAAHVSPGHPAVAEEPRPQQIQAGPRARHQHRITALRGGLHKPGYTDGELTRPGVQQGGVAKPGLCQLSHRSPNLSAVGKTSTYRASRSRAGLAIV